MAGELDVVVQFVGDATKLNNSVRGLGDSFDHVAKRAGVFGGLVAAGTTAAINAVTSGARALGSFVASSLKEGEDSVRIGKVQAQLLETTGHAAKVSAKDLDSYAKALSNKTAVDDEAIASAQNVLLTFRAIRNESGKGNKIFDRATKAATDLSAVFGGDLNKSAKQLGKALQDPVKGISALSRVGVQFTQQQKDQIKKLVEHNDILGAQKIILGEVEHEVGNAATANATATERMSVAWKNFKEEIGKAILPAFEAITNVLVDTVLPKIESFVDSAIGALQRFGQFVGDAFSAGLKGIDAGSFDSLAGGIQKIANLAGKGFKKMLDELKELAQWAKDNTEIVKTAGVALGTFATALAAIAAVKGTASAIQSIGSGLAGLLGSLGPLGLIVAAILAIGAAAIYAYTHIKPFRDAVDNLVQAFKDAPAPIKAVAIAIGVALAPVIAIIAAVVLAVRNWDQISAIAKRVWGDVRQAFDSAMKGIEGAAQRVATVVEPLISGIASVATAFWRRFGDEITGILVAVGQLFAAVFQQIEGIVQAGVTIISTAIDFLRGAIVVLQPLWDLIAAAWQQSLLVIQTALSVFVAVIQQIWALWGDEFLTVVQTVWGFIEAVIEGALRIIQGVIQVFTGLISGDWRKAWDGIKNIASGAVEGIKASLNLMIVFLRTVWSSITSLITAPWDAGKKAIGEILGGIGQSITHAFSTANRALKDSLNSIISIINDFIGAYNAIPFAPNIPKIPKLDTGGVVTKTGLAVVHRGEVFSGTNNQMGFGSTNITVNVYPTGLGADVPEIQRAVVNAVRGYVSRNGPVENVAS